ncbi:NAD(P)-dependent dehydrogenase, short-chain alcohol dehydrogenase family [Lutibacter oricola]|uniref:NAD(P)-dependent dehydrogenase, short-chain alcohol dehydrogenase family n=1 Tax=Lutibacter oricola TaxID=762486 RepID=A0A1H2QYY9_9FLAO|nr:SDR family NAD(P)-dependent oxidoreductase [Lutibacter oricola]SDW11864.1 NAD(P)-dependent dehydrogenase, short-chain alcohol dehydrogenase family [Lutibacter oricola]
MAKTILITGSTDGIGKLTAIKLANEGHTVLVHGRNSEKLKSTISEIKETTNNSNIDGFVADLSNFDEVKQLAIAVQEKISKLDVLINNAGVYKSNAVTNKNGLDMRYAVNYFAPYLLTNMLLPLLKNSETPRVISLSSAAQAPIKADTLLGETNEIDGATYAQSKLALLMWNFYLATKEPNIVVIPVNPGSLLATKMVKEAFGNSWSSADKGADILYDLAISENHKNNSGKYFDNDKGSYANAHPDAYNEAKIEQLIELTEKVLA